MNQLQRDTRNL